MFCSSNKKMQILIHMSRLKLLAFLECTRYVSLLKALKQQVERWDFVWKGLARSLPAQISWRRSTVVLTVRMRAPDQWKYTWLKRSRGVPNWKLKRASLFSFQYFTTFYLKLIQANPSQTISRARACASSRSSRQDVKRVRGEPPTTTH